MLVAFKFARVEIVDSHDNNRSKILYKATKDEESIIEPDRTRLSHVISNLLDITIKFTKEGGGTISIVVEKKKDS
jgi:signal transduction histidine kinase